MTMHNTRTDKIVNTIVATCVVLALGATLIILLAGCSSVRKAIEPEIVIKTVNVEVPVKCKTDIDLSEQVYPDTKAAIAAAPTLFEKGQLVLAANQLRAARLEILEPLVRSCFEKK